MRAEPFVGPSEEASRKRFVRARTGPLADHTPNVEPEAEAETEATRFGDTHAEPPSDARNEPFVGPVHRARRTSRPRRPAHRRNPRRPRPRRAARGHPIPSRASAPLIPAPPQRRG